MTYEEQAAVYRARCEEALAEAAKQFFAEDSAVSRAAVYSLLNGGKRVRGTLVLAVCDLLEGDGRVAEPFSAAVEMIHAFSLIHDDLPCMDDDDMRRGKPATHIEFGEANALLAGDMLALQAPEVLAAAPAPEGLRLQAVRLLANAAGSKGMILGQELDLYYETKQADAEALANLHAHKTGALILAAARLGALAAGRQSETAVEQYAQNLGRCFQVVDDILDVTSTDAVLGKPVGSDAKSGKSTFVTLFGLEKAKQEVRRFTEGAVAALRAEYAGKADFLVEYAHHLENRIL